MGSVNFGVFEVKSIMFGLIENKLSFFGYCQDFFLL